VTTAGGEDADSKAKGKLRKASLGGPGARQ